MSGGIAAVVLAGGRSTRSGERFKLTAPLDGVPLIRRTVLSAMAAPVAATVVVTGHRAADVRAALEGLDVALVANLAYAGGIATSIKAGIAAVGGYAGALVCLGDMPFVTPATLAALIAAHRPGKHVAPVYQARQGNPVLWDASAFGRLAGLEGDTGGKQIMRALADDFLFVDVSDPGVVQDVDTLGPLGEPVRS